MTIDTHVHFWNFDPVRDNWINDEMSVIQRDFLPENLATTFDLLQVDGCIAVQANQSEIETKFLLDLAGKHEIIKGIVGWTDLLNPDLEERLDHWHSFDKVKGWRHVLQAEQEAFFLDSRLAHGISMLAKYDYTYDLLIYHDQLNALLNLVNKVPEQALVLDHCGKPNIKSGDIGDWKTGIRTLATNQNIYCKISGLLAEADWYNWTEKQLFDCFDIIFENFGTNRIMYGSDWPVMLISRPYGDWLKLVQKYCSQFTIADQQSVFYKNAEHFYKFSI
jgi:L-fuconolactonase